MTEDEIIMVLDVDCKIRTTDCVMTRDPYLKRVMGDFKYSRTVTAMASR